MGHGILDLLSRANPHIKPHNDGTWTHPSSESVLEDVSLFSMETWCI